MAGISWGRRRVKLRLLRRCVCVGGGLLGNSFEFRLFDEARLFTFLSAPNIFSMFNTLTNISAKY